jgi:hypothetical protein
LWEPASQNGKLVACTFELPVLFQLSQRSLLKPYKPTVLDTTFIYDALNYKPRFVKGQYHLKSVIRNAIQESLNKMDQNHAGVVKASFCVDVNGQVKNVQVLESSGIDYDEMVSHAIRKLPSFIRVRPTDLEQKFIVVVPFK